MSDASKIEWCDASWNPLRAAHLGKFGWHCEHVSEGCRNCYAEGINRRLGTGLDYKPGHRPDLEFFLREQTLLQPLHWRRPRKIFVGSMTDLFGDWVTDGQLDRVFAVMALCPQHTFQVLTKRPERMRDYFAHYDRCNRINGFVWSLLGTPKGSKIEHGGNWRASSLPLPNVWLGTSCEDQQTADERIPHLLDTPAAVRFVSAEPLLGPIDLSRIDGRALDPESAGIKLDALRGGCRSATPWHLNWVIVGGESGANARPIFADWVRSIREQCAAAAVSFFFKQWGGKHKRLTGRLLDGVEHNAFPRAMNP